MRLKSGAEAEVGFEFEPQCTQQEAVKWRNPCQVFNVWGLVQGPSPPLASFKPETAQRPASRLTDHSRERERGWAGYPTLQQVGFRGAVCPSPAVWPAQRCRSSPPLPPVSETRVWLRCGDGPRHALSRALGEFSSSSCCLSLTFSFPSSVRTLACVNARSQQNHFTFVSLYLSSYLPVFDTHPAELVSNIPIHLIPALSNPTSLWKRLTHYVHLIPPATTTPSRRNQSK
jgi:hypothetical protein